MATNLLTDQLKALGDPTRFKIMQIIEGDQKLCVSQVAERVGISVAGTSQHLSMLEKSGLVVRTREAHRICYRYNGNSELLKTLMPLIHKV